MSTLPDFTGPGFFAGEAPDGLTTIAGTPTSAQVRVYWRDPADPQAPDVLVAQTTSAPDGTWRITGLNLALRYVVRAQKSQFDDVTVVGAAPSRSDVIAYVDQLVPREDVFGDVDGLTGHVLLDSGLPPFTCQVIEPLPYGLTARVDGRKLLIEGVSTDNGLWDSVVRVTASNGVWVDVPVQVQIQVLHLDPHWDKVVSLLHFDGVNGSASFIDETGRLWVAKGNAKISSEQALFGDTSGKFFGVGSRIDTAPTFDFSFGTGDFTVEGWLYVGPPPGGANTNDRSIFGAFAFNPDMNFFLGRNDNTLSLWNGTTALASSMSVPTNSWSHFAYVRESGVLRMFVGGVMGYEGAFTTNFNSIAVADIGSERAASRALNGYLDSFRITKGVARYTANFTPPDKRFPNR